MGNRKQPFGYMIAGGELTVNSQEAELVKYIFTQYIMGMSFQNIAQSLNEQSVPYEAQKLWNKNMVARILEDKRYLGDRKYPKLITADEMEQAASKRSTKQQPYLPTEAQKLLRRLSGQRPTQRMEQQVLNVLNNLIRNPEKIVAPDNEISNASELTRLQRALDNELLQQPIDEEKAKTLIFAISNEKYSALGSEEYETQRLQRIFSRASPLTELDAELIRSSISAINIGSRDSITIILKNNQEIGGEHQ